MAVIVSHRCDCIVICINCLGTVVTRTRYFAARAKAAKEEEDSLSTQNNRHTMLERSGWKMTGSLKGGAPPDKSQDENEFESDTESKPQPGPSTNKGKSIKGKSLGKRSIIPLSDHEDSSGDECVRRRKARDDRRKLMITCSKKGCIQAK